MKNLYLSSRLSWIFKVRNEVFPPTQLKVTSGIFTMHMGNDIYRGTGATQRFKWHITEARAGDYKPILMSACGAPVFNLIVICLIMKYVNTVALYLQIRALSSDSFYPLWKEKKITRPGELSGKYEVGGGV